MTWRPVSESDGTAGAVLTKWHHFRGALLLCVLLLGFAALGARLVQLQVIQHEYFIDKAELQQRMRRPICAGRGGIYDLLGRPLCVSVPARSVFLVPNEIALDNVPRVSLALSRVLSVDEAELRNGILRNYDRQFMWVKRLVSEPEAAMVRQMNFHGVGFRTEYRRTFPQGITAPHAIGWVNIDQVGQEGLELTYDRELSGENGYEWLECDGTRRPLLTERAECKPAVHGCDIRLTIDAEIQRIVHEELDQAVAEWEPLSVTMIVMEVKTGRILALANHPTYSPVHPGRAKPEERLNRAVAACYEPGSIFKPFAMAGYLEAGLGRIGDTIFCENGLFQVRGRRLRDHHPFGWLTLTEVIEKSSNVGMAKIGLQMGAHRLYGTIRAFGFGQSTGSGLPGEIPGIITPFNRWSYYTETSVPMGHEISATPMQLITAFNAIANDGVLLKPQLIERITDADGKVIFEYRGQEIVQRVISSETARTLIDPMLSGVITNGTGKGANVGSVPKFGKTGTAQKASEGGYAHSRFVSSFLCGAPIEDPKITVLVLMDEPQRGASYYGGTVAAPAAGRIVEKTMKYLSVPTGQIAGGPDL